MPQTRRQELSDFLRSRRERLTPREVGLPLGARRRTVGLRREEVAYLAGIGIDWYVRLEQGRAVNPSVSTVDSLARALRLTKVEHAHLRALVGPEKHHVFTPEVVSPMLRRIVESLIQPAYVTGRRWDVLVWNAAAEDIFSFGELAEPDRNTLVLVLTNPDARRLFGDGWAREARRMVAQFRASHDLWAGDPAFRELFDRLSAGCTEFDGWWEAHDISASTVGLKRMSHPRKGELNFEYATFQANDDRDLKLAIYIPV